MGFIVIIRIQKKMTTCKKIYEKRDNIQVQTLKKNLGNNAFLVFIQIKNKLPLTKKLKKKCYVGYPVKIR